MKQTFFLSVLLLMSFFVKAQYQTNSSKEGFYQNPIFAGDYPDPSILKDGETFYMVHSSFEYYPGLLIWKSKDMINWAPVKSTLTKYVGSVWAPDLVKFNNKYYIYFPANNANYVIWADSINGKWSDPIDLKISYIDPGHVVDNNGKRYLYFSSGGYFPLADDGLSVSGEYSHAYNGWQIPRDWSIECFCLEGPKLTKRGDYYYLTVAEGGTAGPATSHMIISARSKSPLGPWENSPYNPIERTLQDTEKWWSKGHGTLLEDNNGKWWIIFHAYENGHYNMGRQTLMEPVEWTKDGWFKIAEGTKTDGQIKKPMAKSTSPVFTLNDNFDGNSLKPQWKFFGEYDTNRFDVKDNTLTIKAKGKSTSDCSPLLVVPSHHSYTVDVEVTIEGNAQGGLVLFYNGAYNSGILADNENILANLRGWQFPTEKKVIKNHAFLRLKNVNNTVDMFYSLDGTKWNKIENSLEVSGMHHNVLSGFMSLRIGLCAVGEGVVKFKNFRYNEIK